MSAVLTLSCLYPGIWRAHGDPNQLRPALNVRTNGLPLDLGDYAIPCVTDWNGDGLPDLLAGYRSADKIAVFYNCGTAAQPAFTNGINLQAGNADIQHPSSGCGAPAPWACDYDGDGKRDLLVGSGTDGRVVWYRNTNTDARPIVGHGISLGLTNGSALTVSYRATPYLHDWNEDGLQDLLCGNGDGWVYWFQNVGSAALPAFRAGVQLQAGGVNLNNGIRSIVRVCDWDGDGIKDLVGSSSTAVFWCRNVGSNAGPVLSAPLLIRAPVAGRGLVPIVTGARMRLDLADWNYDGIVDLLLGNADGTIYWYEGYRFQFNAIVGLNQDGFVWHWNSAPGLQYTILAGDTPQNINNLLATNLPSGGTTTQWTNLPAAPRQFLRVRIAE